MITLYGWAVVTWWAVFCFFMFYVFGYFAGRKYFTPGEKRSMIVEMAIWGFFTVTGIYPIFFGA